MSKLQQTIDDLAQRFARDLVAALRGASLEEIINETGAGHTRTTKRAPRAAGFVATSRQSRKGGRLARRSEADLAGLADKIVALVKSSKEGVSAEGIKAALRIERKELPRPLGMALGSKKIKKKGVKRATKYYGA